MRRIVFALLLGRVDREFLKEVFIDAPDQILLFAKRLVADLVDFVNQFLDVVRFKIAGCKGAFHKTTLKLLAVGRDTAQGVVQRNVEP